MARGLQNAMMTVEICTGRRVSEMATKAYFLIRVGEEFRHNGYAGWLKHLESMPEVQDVAPVTGLYDAVATVEAPITATLLAHKIMGDNHVKHLHVLRVEEPARKEPRLSLRRQREIIHARKGEMRRFIRPRATD
jgi:hypothetical protein